MPCVHVRQIAIQRHLAIPVRQGKQERFNMPGQHKHGHLHASEHDVQQAAAYRDAQPQIL
eukprot:1158281-Pelagomonas_calceolata.AAC.1